METGKETPDWAANYINLWINRLRLGRWYISSRVVQDTGGSEVATIDMDRAYLRATIELRSDIPETDTEEGEELKQWKITIIHELIHLVIADLHYYVIDDLMPLLGGQAHRLALNVHEPLIEQVIESLARSFYYLELKK